MKVLGNFHIFYFLAPVPKKVDTEHFYLNNPSLSIHKRKGNFSAQHINLIQLNLHQIT